MAAGFDALRVLVIREYAGVPALAAIAAFYVLPARFRFIFYWVAIVLLNAAAHVVKEAAQRRYG